MSKIRVLQLNKLYAPETGGIERVVQYIAEGLKDRTDMRVLVCRKKGRATVGKVNGVQVYRSGSLGVLFSVPVAPAYPLAVRHLAKETDILQCHMPFPLGDLSVLLSGYWGKVVLWWHSDVVKQKKLMLLYRPLMERFLKRADLILVGSQGIIDGSEYLGPYRDKCRVIPLAVNPDVLQESTRWLQMQSDQANRTADKVKFLFVGRLVGYKGCSVLLDAFAKVSGQAELTIVGTGALEAELKRQCHSLGLDERVRFAGYVSDEEMAGCYQDCDVFVLPSVSRNEAFGLVQLEAMAYAKPVINTNLPSGVPYVSLNGETGLTVEPGDAEALAEAMQRLTDCPKLRNQYGTAGRKRLENYFTLEKVLPQIYREYEKLLRRRDE